MQRVKLSGLVQTFVCGINPRLGSHSRDLASQCRAIFWQNILLDPSNLLGEAVTEQFIMETEREEEKNSEHHEEQDQEQPSAPSHTGTTRQPLKELETPLSLLKSPDDTSRFVGLAILKPVLERELIQEKREDEEKQAIILRCWKAIQPKFLDGLLRANSSVKTSKEDAKNMVTLAVAIM